MKVELYLLVLADTKHVKHILKQTI